MKDLMLRFQLFVHKNFDYLKLFLLIIILSLLLYALFYQIEQNARSAQIRDEAITRVITSIEEETEAQTIIINRQFRALCVLILDVSGEEALARLDEDTRERCEELARDPDAVLDRPATEEPTTPPPPTPTEEPDPEPAPEEERRGPTNRPREPDAPGQPDRPTSFLFEGDPVIGCLLGICI